MEIGKPFHSSSCSNCKTASIGFLLGIFFLLVLDSLVPHLHLESDKPEGIKSKLNKTTMLVFAVKLHNIPEGRFQSRQHV